MVQIFAVWCEVDLVRMTIGKTCMETNNNWYVVQTISGEEHKLANLITKTVPRELYDRCFVPVRTEKRYYKGETRYVSYRLFPGYFFIISDDADKIFLKLRDNGKYIKFLKSEASFEHVSSNEVKILKRLLRLEDDNHVLQQKRDKFEQKVDISLGIIKEGRLHAIDGPIKGLEEYVIKVDRHKCKATLEMTLFREKKTFVMGLEILKEE